MRSAVMRRAAETGTASATDAVVLLRTRLTDGIRKP